MFSARPTETSRVELHAETTQAMWVTLTGKGTVLLCPGGGLHFWDGKI